MNPLFLPFLSYAFVTTFTPGPNNVTASAIGLRYGYRRSLPFLAGMTLGFFSLMLASGLLTDFLLRTYSVIAPWVKWIGVTYMIWLGISSFLPHRTGSGKDEADATFLAGFLLQYANPKLILYVITIYTSFSPLIAGSMTVATVSATFLAGLGFAAGSLWSLTGSFLRRFLKRPAALLTFNVVMALMLAWCAWSIARH